MTSIIRNKNKMDTEAEAAIKVSSDYIKGLIEKLNAGTIDVTEIGILEEYTAFVSEMIAQNNKI